MSGPQLRRLAILVGVLLVLWGLSVLFSHRSDRTRGALALPALPAALTDTVTITRGRDTVRLVQTAPGVWTVNGFRATPGAGSDLVKALGDTSPRDIVSISASSLARMGLDSAAWKLVVGPAAQPRLTLLVGSAGQEYGTGYVRRPTSDTVYLWRGSLPSLVRRSSDAWRDHHIASVPPDSVHAIEIAQHGRRYALERGATGWTIGGARADSQKVTVLLAQFRNLSAQGFGGPHTADSLRRVRPRAERLVTLRGKGATPLLALTLDSAAGFFWATRPGDSTVYRLDAWQVLQLTPLADSLRAHH